ncbi:hypothetical protein T261_0764 [Streptomyces lydicus]|nr:hypothetical protein T261_0764 [Streptomyces lydicus]
MSWISVAEVRAVAWQAQTTLATRAPFCTNGVDRDRGSIVGASVEHSVHVERVLNDLLVALGPNDPLTFEVFEACRAAHELSQLRELWVAYYGERPRLGADEVAFAMDREFPDPARVRAWPLYETARRRTELLNERLVQLHPELAAFTGSDLGKLHAHHRRAS